MVNGGATTDGVYHFIDGLERQESCQDEFDMKEISGRPWIPFSCGNTEGGTNRWFAAE